MADSIPHDPSRGFHDIKPPPEFLPFPWTALWITLAVIVIAALAYWLTRPREKKAAPLPPPIPPFEAALAEIARLEGLRIGHRISLRELSAGVSLALRLYLERSLNFPAAEQTTVEVRQSLTAALPRALPVQPKERLSGIADQVKRLLSLMERFAFAGDSVERFHLESEEVSGTLKQTEETVREIQELLKKEEERTRSVAHSSALQNPGEQRS